MFKRNFFFGKAGMLSRILCMSVFLLTLLSCQEKEEVRPLSVEGDGLEEAITIGAGVSLRTKATDAGFELDDMLGIYLCKWKSASEKGELLSSGNYADNAMFRLVGLPDSWGSDQAYYYPADGSLLDFYAYYPYRKPCFSSEGTVLDLNVSSDQSSYADYTRSDFMTSVVKGVRRSSGKVHLDFYHRLSQIVFRLVPGVGFTEDDLLSAKVRIVNAIVDARYDLSQKLDSFPVAGSERRTIVPCGSWVKGDGELQGVKAILIPQEINEKTYVEVTVGSRRFTFKPSSAIRMNPGCSREFTITVSNTGIDIETEIHPWDECPPVSGDATEDREDDSEEAIVKMTTLADTLSFLVDGKSIEVDWGDGVREKDVFTHIYTDGVVSHDVTFYGADSVLKTLNCKESKLTKLDVSQNKNLTSLYCNDNQLKVLDVSQNRKLAILTCGYNQLTELNLIHNPELTVLWCAWNELTALDLSHCPKLFRLHCMSNQLRSLNVKGCANLGVFYCTDNQLSTLDINDCIVLSMLYIGNNLFDQKAVTDIVNSLPDRNGMQKGWLETSKAEWNNVLRLECEAKNWNLQEKAE